MHNANPCGTECCLYKPSSLLLLLPVPLHLPLNVCSRSTNVAVPRYVVATFAPMLHQTHPENLYYGIFLYIGPVKRPSITRRYSDYCLNNPHHVMLVNVWVIHAYVW